MHRGTSEGDHTALVATETTTFPIDEATCSSEGPVTGSVSLVKGTGAYEGISGELTITLSDG